MTAASPPSMAVGVGSTISGPWPANSDLTAAETVSAFRSLVMASKAARFCDGLVTTSRSPSVPTIWPARAGVRWVASPAAAAT